MNEYVLLFRKGQTDKEKGYADQPVTKEKAEYPRSRWQVDAAGHWNSDGNQLPDPETLKQMPIKSVISWWRGWCEKHRYNYKEHLAVNAALEENLPTQFALFPPISRHPEVWTDIARMRVLNSEQSKRNEENHVCPLQLDIVERLITRYSNPGEIVFDPFAGIFTVPYVAIHQGRKGWGTELSAEYFRSGVGYCEMAEQRHNAPTLFDLQSQGAQLVETEAA